MKKIRIGSGAGYAGDRLEPALELIEKGNLDYISFECLAERTIAIAQQEKLKNPSKGYNGLLEYRMQKVLPIAWDKKVKVITNMGAANPQAGAEAVYRIAKELGIKGIKIAAVTGDDVGDRIDQYRDIVVWETGKSLKELDGEIISANAYLGSGGIVKALEMGADVVITGRVSDPAIFMAPLIYEFGWSLNDYDVLGKGTLVGHLLECGGQATGGYYAEPSKKDVEGLARLGFPIAEVSENGSFIVTKVEGSGGEVTRHTLTEQLLYEIHDPANYITPDVNADFSNVEFHEVEKDVVLVSGASGKKETGSFKVSVGYKDCYIGEGEISYGGPGAYERGMLAREIVKERLEIRDIKVDEIKYDIIGVSSLYWNSERKDMKPEEVRLRVSARTKDKATAAKIGGEVETLYTNGPAGGGGATKKVSEVISVASILIPKEDVNVDVRILEVN
jgi:hypothetical protein